MCVTVFILKVESSFVPTPTIHRQCTATTTRGTPSTLNPWDQPEEDSLEYHKRQYIGGKRLKTLQSSAPSQELVQRTSDKQHHNNRSNTLYYKMTIWNVDIPKVILGEATLLTSPALPCRDRHGSAQPTVRHRPPKRLFAAAGIAPHLGQIPSPWCFQA